MPQILCITTLLSAGFAAAAADEKSDAANFARLAGELQKHVPEGWVVTSSLQGDGPPWTRPRPTILIRSARKVPVEQQHPGGAAGLKPDVKPDFVTLRLHLMPYVSQKEFTAAATENRKRRKARLAFAKKHLKGVKRAWKGPEPFPPRAYKPATPAEKKRVAEYVFLWLRTQPRKLPTHRYRTLSLLFLPADDVVIHDKRRSGEYQRILETIEETLAKYARQADDVSRRFSWPTLPASAAFATICAVKRSPFATRRRPIPPSGSRSVRRDDRRPVCGR